MDNALTAQEQRDFLGADGEERAADLRSRVTFLDWRLQVWVLAEDETAGTGACLMQWLFRAPEAQTGAAEVQFARVWFLDPAKPQWEWVGTAFAAAKMAVEHEVREHFRDNGVAIYSPHLGAPGRRTDG
jgi:hypothetical protein